MEKTACGEKDILLQDIGHGSGPKSTCAAWPHGSGQVQGWLCPQCQRRGAEPQLEDIQGYLSPGLDLCMTQQLPSLCCAHSPHLPVPTSIRAGTAEEQCTTLPETGAPGTAPGPDPCTPAGRSPEARAGSARGTRLGCSCKHSPASGRPGAGCCHPWHHLSSSSELGSPMFPGEVKWCPQAGEDTSAPSPAAAVGHPKSSDRNLYQLIPTSQGAGIPH